MSDVLTNDAVLRMVQSIREERVGVLTRTIVDNTHWTGTPAMAHELALQLDEALTKHRRTRLKALFEVSA